MNILGFNITRPATLKPGLAFAERSFTNHGHLVQAQRAGIPPSSTSMISVPNNSYGNGVSHAPIGDDLESRSIRSDPRELWYLSLPNKLTPQQCLNIMRAALGGDIWQQWQLLSLMLDTWPTFRMASHQLREAVSYAKFAVHPFSEEGEEPSKLAKEKAGLITRAMKSMKPDPFNDEKGFTGMIYDFMDAAMNGLSLVELLWNPPQRVKGGQEKTVRAAAWVHPRHFTFTNTGSICVFDDDYGRLYDDPRLQGRSPMRDNSPDPDKFVAAQFISRSGSALGAGFMRPLVLAWAARQWCWEWALNTAKQFGSPFIDITYKPGQSDAAERGKLSAFMKNAGAERRLLHPEGTVAQIHPAQSLGAENPQRYLMDEADKLCLFLLLGQTATTVAIPGSLGGQDMKQDVKQERVAALAQWVAHNPLKQWVRAIIRQNYGNEDECPNVEPDFTKPLNSGEVGQLAGAISASGLPVRADELYRKLGLTLPEPGDMVFQKGELKEQLTEEDAFELQLEQQQMMAEAQMGPEPQGKPEKKKGAKVKATDQNHTLAILATAPAHKLAELEAAVTAAEQAEHLNGEFNRVQELVEAMAGEPVDILFAGGGR